ncbi:MAG: hypothetical protein H7255_03150 [Ramlibacter sp.]|nr:hypothetical protein [Ramlibacter sp.]
MALLNTSGKIKMLRVNEVGDRFGPAADFIQAEVIVQLEQQMGDTASGFKLRVDANQPVRQGMLDLLRDAFNHGWRVHFDHEVPAGKAKGTIIRVRVTKELVVPGGGLVNPGLVFGTIGTTPAAPTGPLVPAVPVAPAPKIKIKSTARRGKSTT